ncbi:hypothetical protein AgCh_016186 [Apium graveolens]
MHGIKVCRKDPIISHIFFADDSYFYCKADKVEAVKVIELLDVYEQAYGQKVNRGKSSVFFSSNVIADNRQLVCRVLQMEEANENSTYLGLPNLIGRNKLAILGYFKEKATAKVKSWDGNYISRSGKEILIKSVAQALPTYAMNVFLLPIEIKKNIEKTLSHYWWKTSQAKNSCLIWMNWERRSKHKSSGGMGFRDFRDFNLAMLGKQGWRFISNPNSLVTKLYKARYFANSDFLNSELGHNPSFIWHSICEAKHLIRDGVRWRIGTGDNINIVGQPWLDNKENPYITSGSQALKGRSVASLFHSGSKEWDLDVIKTELNDRDQKCILDTVVTDNTRGDVLSSSKVQAEVITLCWAIWRNRNDIVWNQRFSSVNRTVVAAKQYLTQWSLAQNRSSNTLLQPLFEGDGDCIWVNPQHNSVKVSVDAAVFYDRDAVGSGLIARDDKGVLILAKTVVWLSPVAPVLAEAMAVKEALSWIDEIQWSKVVLASDCLVVEQVIRSKTPMRSQLGSVIEDFRKYLRRLNKVSLYHVKRSANMVAHQLARESYNYRGRILIGTPFRVLLNIVLSWI